jgi:LPXTG-motif cell wall-anchored protein
MSAKKRSGGGGIWPGADVSGRNFALGAILPQTQRSIIQCTSTAGPGETISLLSVSFLTATVTSTGEDGSVTRQASYQSTNLATSTVVQSSAATVYAPPVNGFNLVKQQLSATSTGETSTTATQTSTSAAATSDASTESSGPSAGVIAGAVVGAVAGLGLLALGAFFFLRRKRRYSTVDRTEAPMPMAGGEGAKYYSTYGSTQGTVVSEMPAQHQVYGHQVHELPHGMSVHELPGQN